MVFTLGIKRRFLSLLDQNNNVISLAVYEVFDVEVFIQIAFVTQPCAQRRHFLLDLK